MLQIIKYYKFFLFLSGTLVGLSIVALILFGLNFGIDFRGGALLELKFDSPVDPGQLTNTLLTAGYPNVKVQLTGEGTVIIKTQSLNSENERQRLVTMIRNKHGEFEELRFDSIGPLIGAELRRRALWQIALVLLGILLYIAYAFRKVAEGRADKKISPWRMSWAAIAALAHDILIVLGVFSVLGKFWQVEVDSLFITAVLTILGFSVHDTIVVFDRVRENMRKETGLSFDETLNYSINQTLVRSINTSVTVIFVLLALAFFGGSSIFYFTVALLIGIIVGTYSSIYIASALLWLWHYKSVSS